MYNHTPHVPRNNLLPLTLYKGTITQLYYVAHQGNGFVLFTPSIKLTNIKLERKTQVFAVSVCKQILWCGDRHEFFKAQTRAPQWKHVLSLCCLHTYTPRANLMGNCVGRIWSPASPKIKLLSCSVPVLCATPQLPRRQLLCSSINWSSSFKLK